MQVSPPPVAPFEVENLPNEPDHVRSGRWGVVRAAANLLGLRGQGRKRPARDVDAEPQPRWSPQGVSSGPTSNEQEDGFFSDEEPLAQAAKRRARGSQARRAGERSELDPEEGCGDDFVPAFSVLGGTSGSSSSSTSSSSRPAQAAAAAAKALPNGRRLPDSDSEEEEGLHGAASPKRLGLQGARNTLAYQEKFHGHSVALRLSSRDFSDEAADRSRDRFQQLLLEHVGRSAVKPLMKSELDDDCDLFTLPGRVGSGDAIHIKAEAWTAQIFAIELANASGETVIRWDARAMQKKVTRGANKRAHLQDDDSSGGWPFMLFGSSVSIMFYFNEDVAEVYINEDRWPAFDFACPVPEVLKQVIVHKSLRNAEVYFFEVPRMAARQQNLAYSLLSYRVRICPEDLAGEDSAATSAPRSSSSSSSASFRISGELMADKAQATLAVQKCGLDLRRVSEGLTNNREVVLEAVKQDGRALRYAGKDCLRDRQIVTEALRSGGLSVLAYVPEEVQKIPEIITVCAHIEEKCKMKGTGKRFIEVGTASSLNATLAKASYQQTGRKFQVEMIPLCGADMLGLEPRGMDICEEDLVGLVKPPWMQSDQWLLSSQERQFAGSQKLLTLAEGYGDWIEREAISTLYLTNYRVLSPHGRTAPIRISKTEQRGITHSQLQNVLAFLAAHAEVFKEHTKFVPGRFAQPVEFESMNLYQADYWLIRPATLFHRCSFVEYVAEKPQPPTWFASHFWGEPIYEFAKCIEKHMERRMLDQHAAYWVCAYANNQHQLDDIQGEDPESSSFYKAMSLSVGVLLILDCHATPFRRIWCCFEESVALTQHERGGRNQPMLLDIATVPKGSDTARLLLDGFTPNEEEMVPVLVHLLKSRSSESFPMGVLTEGLCVNISQAQASMPQDKVKILNSIADRRRLRPACLAKWAPWVFLFCRRTLNRHIYNSIFRAKKFLCEPKAKHKNYITVNSRLRGKFARASWQIALETDSSVGKDLHFVVAGESVGAVRCLFGVDDKPPVQDPTVWVQVKKEVEQEISEEVIAESVAAGFARLLPSHITDMKLSELNVLSMTLMPPPGVNATDLLQALRSEESTPWLCEKVSDAITKGLSKIQPSYGSNIKVEAIDSRSNLVQQVEAALSSDASCQLVHQSFVGCAGFGDNEFLRVMGNLPPNLACLILDASMTPISTFAGFTEEFCCRASCRRSLHHVELRFSNCRDLTEVINLGSLSAFKRIRTLTINLANCWCTEQGVRGMLKGISNLPKLSNLHIDMHGCSLLAPPAQTLFVTSHKVNAASLMKSVLESLEVPLDGSLAVSQHYHRRSTYYKQIKQKSCGSWCRESKLTYYFQKTTLLGAATLVTSTMGFYDLETTREIVAFWTILILVTLVANWHTVDLSVTILSAVTGFVLLYIVSRVLDKICKLDAHLAPLNMVVEKAITDRVIGTEGEIDLDWFGPASFQFEDATSSPGRSIMSRYVHLRATDDATHFRKIVRRLLQLLEGDGLSAERAASTAGTTRQYSSRNSISLADCLESGDKSLLAQHTSDSSSSSSSNERSNEGGRGQTQEEEGTSTTNSHLPLNPGSHEVDEDSDEENIYAGSLDEDIVCSDFNQLQTCYNHLQDMEGSYGFVIRGVVNGFRGPPQFDNYRSLLVRLELYSGSYASMQLHLAEAYEIWERMDTWARTAGEVVPSLNMSHNIPQVPQPVPGWVRSLVLLVRIPTLLGCAWCAFGYAMWHPLSDATVYVLPYALIALLSLYDLLTRSWGGNFRDPLHNRLAGMYERSIGIYGPYWPLKIVIMQFYVILGQLELKIEPLSNLVTWAFKMNFDFSATYWATIVCIVLNGWLTISVMWRYSSWCSLIRRRYERRLRVLILFADAVFDILYAGSFIWISVYVAAHDSDALRDPRVREYMFPADTLNFVISFSPFVHVYAISRTIEGAYRMPARELLGVPGERAGSETTEIDLRVRADRVNNIVMLVLWLACVPASAVYNFWPSFRTMEYGMCTSLRKELARMSDFEFLGIFSLACFLCMGYQKTALPWRAARCVAVISLSVIFSRVVFDYVLWYDTTFPCFTDLFNDCKVCWCKPFRLYYEDLTEEVVVTVEKCFQEKLGESGELDLSSLSIGELLPGAFSEFTGTSLSSINLANNSLVALEAGTLATLTSLGTLDLHDNRFQNVPNLDVFPQKTPPETFLFSGNPAAAKVPCPEDGSSCANALIEWHSTSLPPSFAISADTEVTVTTRHAPSKWEPVQM